MYDAIQAETITLAGHGGDAIEAYAARTLQPGPVGGVVVIHHMPGYDDATKEIARRFAYFGYNAVVPNLFWRQAPGAAPDDASAAARAAGGVSNEQLLGDVGAGMAALRSLSNSNGKVGSIGYCSGGRQSVLAACSLPLDAAVNCYGAYVTKATPPERADAVSPILEQLGNLSCPLLGLFGADDVNPSPQDTSILAAELDRLGKPYEFHTFEDAGHAFFSVDRPGYRYKAANAGWQLIRGFYGKHLAG